MLGRANISRSGGSALDDRLEEVGSVVAVDAAMVMLVMLLHQSDVGSCSCCPRCYPVGVNIAAVVAMNNVCDVGVVVIVTAGIKVPAFEIVIGMGQCLGLFVLWSQLSLSM